MAVRRLIEARIRLGEFDPPGYEGNPYNKITADMNDSPRSQRPGTKVADESMVLLKNANHTLPLKTSIGTIAVMGPNANAFSACRTANTTARPRRSIESRSLTASARPSAPIM